MLLANPEVFGESYADSRELRDIRCQLTIQMALVAAKLYKARFAEVGRICRILEVVSEGRPVSTAEIVWLDNAIDQEAS